MSRSKPTLLYACFGVSPDAWTGEIHRHFPELQIHVWPRPGDPADIDFALVWKQPKDFLRQFPNLKVIYSMGMGVEHILGDRTVPAAIPIVRMVDPSLVVGMNEFVLMRVLHYHRSMVAFEAQQRARNWQQICPPLPGDRTVGILGLGELGSYCGRALAGLGFDVAGWSRSLRTVPGIRNFHGRDQLPAFLARTEILVCLLPLTAETESLIDANCLGQLPRGAFFINVARGRLVVEEDLLAALGTGQIAHATLDVFRDEPLPHDHPLWDHPQVTVVPHCAALTQPKTAARTLADNLKGFLAGKPLQNVVDRAIGY